MEYIYEGKTKKECLEKASKELGISEDKIKYTIKEESKGLFSKKCKISVEYDEVQKDDNKSSTNDMEDKKNTKEKGEEVKTTSSEIILDENDINEYELYFDVDINILVNGKKVINGTKVTSKDKITFSTEKIKAERSINIEVEPNKVTVTTKYLPEYVAKIYCRKINGNNLRVKKKMEEGRKPPLYTRDQILKLLEKKGVKFGIKKDALNKVTKEYNVSDLVIAEGRPVIDDENDTLKLLFDKPKKRINDNSKETIDYRNSTFIANVCAGDEIAQIIIGKEGQNGVDVFGNETPRKVKKTLDIKPGQGVKIEGNSFYSLIDGQPNIKGGMLHVHKVLQNPGDVDLKSGNIKFSGDVTINGSVKEGMTVECGNTLEISGSVEQATIKSQGETKIQGSIIGSEIIVGAKNLEKQNYIEALEDFKEDMENLILVVMDVKERNLLGADKTDGQIVKILLETKFKAIQRKALKVFNGRGGKNYVNICNFIRGKIIGAGPLKIKFTSELSEFISWLDEEIKPLKGDIFIPIDIHVMYMQDSKIQATGTVYIDGKGEYVTDIEAKKDVIFTREGSVARGGSIKAKNINAKVVGSAAGVITELRVPKTGNITADVAYQNTTFCFGEMKYVLDKASKGIKAYVDNKGEIVVDKLLL